MEPSPLIVAGCVFPTPDTEMQREWLTALHGAARVVSAEIVGEVEPVAVGRNFCRVTLRTADGEMLTVMLNPAIRTVGAVDGDRPFAANACFASVPGSEVFAANGFTVADPLELSAGLSERNVSSLGNTEAAQVRYHRPDRVGDVIFNWFD